MLDPTKLLTADEIAAIVAWLHHRRRRGPNYVLNRAIFRLSCCCGLSSSEICRLNLGHVVTASAHPVLCVEGSGGRGRRIVPLDWDRQTLFDLAAYEWQRSQQAGSSAPFLCGVSQNAGKRLTTDLVAKRWRSLMRVVLGEERAKQLSIQSGRRTFPSFAAAHGRTLEEISKALGNSNPSQAALCMFAAQRLAG